MRGRTLFLGGATAAGLALGWVLARRHVARHRADLFSRRPLRRLSALTYLAQHPSLDSIRLLRDYLAWEPQPLLRRWARVMMRRLEVQFG